MLTIKKCYEEGSIRSKMCCEQYIRGLCYQMCVVLHSYHPEYVGITGKYTILICPIYKLI